MYAYEFSPISHVEKIDGEEVTTQEPAPSMDVFNNKLIGAKGDVCQSPVIYINNQTTLESDNNGYLIEFIQEGEVVFHSEESIFTIDADVDIYGSTIKLTAIRDNASISKIVINGYEEKISNYNAHISIDDESICVSRDVNITME